MHWLTLEVFSIHWCFLGATITWTRIPSVLRGERNAGQFLDGQFRVFFGECLVRNLNGFFFDEQIGGYRWRWQWTWHFVREIAIRMVCDKCAVVTGRSHCIDEILTTDRSFRQRGICTRIAFRKYRKNRFCIQPYGSSHRSLLAETKWGFFAFDSSKFDTRQLTFLSWYNAKWYKNFDEELMNANSSFHFAVTLFNLQFI